MNLAAGENRNTIKKSDLRQGIEPWLTSLFQSEHLSLLTGTGLSTAIEVMAKGSAYDKLNENLEKTIYEFANSISGSKTALPLRMKQSATKRSIIS